MTIDQSIPGRAARSLGLDRGALSYTGTLAGKPFLRHWTLWSPGEVARFRFMVELDLRSLGAGTSTKTARGELLLAEDGCPLVYVAEDADDRVETRFDADGVHVRLPDGSMQTIPGRADAMVENNHPGQTAVLLAVQQARGASLDGLAVRLYLASSLAMVDYTLTTGGQGSRFVSSLREELAIGEDGNLSSIAMSSADAVVRRADLTASDWDGFLTKSRKPVYRVPAGAAFEARDLTIEGPLTPIGATLNRPLHPTGIGALLIQGSGAVDRNGFAGEIDTGLHEIADHLANRGIATLRYDKRGTGDTPYGTQGHLLGFEAQIDEAAACLAALADEETVDASRCVVVGHSLGGLIGLALSVERRGGTVPCCLLACPGRPFGALVEEQISNQAQLLGQSGDVSERQRRDLSELLDFAAGEDDEAAPAYLQASSARRRYLSELAARDPAALAAAQRAPLLVCQGTRDIQVSAERDAQALHSASPGVSDIRLFDGLDHLFKPAAGGQGIMDYFLDRPVDTAFLEVLSDWILEKV